VLFGSLKSGGTIKILGVAFAILFFQGCITPPIRESSHENPTHESGRNFSPSADAEPGDKHEERSEAVTAVPAAADPPASTDEAEEIIPSDMPAKEGDSLKSDSLNSTGDHPAEALQRVLSLCKLSQIEWKQGELERAIETLDQAYALLLRVDPQNNSRLFQEKEDLRIVISRRMLEIYSSRLAVANGKSRNEIPININRHVKDEIDAFTTGREKDFFISAYRRSGRYRAKIEALLQAAGLPVELAWLPLVESGFKVTALSPARALGLWQFIPSTGYRYNLYRNRYIDERLDVEKSTRGAIEYLKELHAMFGDWTTVLAAYNCGEHRVLRTIQSQSINYLDNFWDLYERLPRETARYVPRFLATLHIVQNLERFGLNDIAVDPELQYESAAVFRQTSLRSIAQMTGIDAERLRELNAELRRGILPPDGYDLRVPPGSADLVASCTNDFPIQPVRPDSSVEKHKVRRGETFSSIGKRYGVPVKRLMSANGIYKAKRLKVGDVLRIPGNDPPAGQTIAAGTSSPTSKAIEYVVRPGDSLYKIAKRFATTTERIQRLNRLSTTSLSVGQILIIQPVV
jgi:membrane-bound lytic murein transglycosylase D